MRRRRASSWLPPLTAAWLLALCLALVAAWGLSLAGCANSEAIHPGLRLEDEDFDKAVERGRSIVSCGDDPYKAYSFDTQQVNLRVTQDVIVREAACCWPADEIAFRIAKQADGDTTAVDRIAKQTRREVERDLKFSVLIQIPKSRDPSTLKFAMRSSAGMEYPPIAVEQPVYVRDISTALDPNMPASALYGYDVHFPIQGSPGYAPISPQISTLTLVVRDGNAEASVSFNMPTQKKRPY